MNRRRKVGLQARPERMRRCSGTSEPPYTTVCAVAEARAARLAVVRYRSRGRVCAVGACEGAAQVRGEEGLGEQVGVVDTAAWAASRATRAKSPRPVRIASSR